MKVSVLGLGRMGSALAVRLAEGGHEVTVWNRSPGKANDAVGAGAREVSELRDAVVSAEVVLTMLANDDAVRSVVADGLANAISSDALYVDCSTVSPALSEELTSEFPHFASMPVLGSPEAVARGTASYLLGARTETASRLAPLTASLSESVRHLPAPKLAVVAKVTGNFLLLTGLVALSEAVAVARSGGLDDEEVRQLFAENPLVAPALRNRFESVVDGSTQGWFAMELGAKDLGLALDVAASTLHVGPAAETAFRLAAESGLDEADVAAVSRIYRV